MSRHFTCIYILVEYCVCRPFNRFTHFETNLYHPLQSIGYGDLYVYFLKFVRLKNNLNIFTLVFMNEFDFKRKKRKKNYFSSFPTSWKTHAHNIFLSYLITHGSMHINTKIIFTFFSFSPFSIYWFLKFHLHLIFIQFAFIVVG